MKKGSLVGEKLENGKWPSPFITTHPANEYLGGAFRSILLQWISGDKR
jgi:hypothetical protein